MTQLGGVMALKPGIRFGMAPKKNLAAVSPHVDLAFITMQETSPFSLSATVRQHSTATSPSVKQLNTQMSQGTNKRSTTWASGLVRWLVRNFVRQVVDSNPSHG